MWKHRNAYSHWMPIAFSTIGKDTGLWWNDYMRSSSNASYLLSEINYVAYTCLALMAVSWALRKGRTVGYCPIHPQTFHLHSYGGSRLILAYAMYAIIWRGGGRGERNLGMILIQNSASISQREIPTFATTQVKPFNFSQPHILPFLNGTKHTLPGS